MSAKIFLNLFIMSVLSNVTGFICENSDVYPAGVKDGRPYDPGFKSFWADEDGRIEGLIIIKNPPFKQLPHGAKFILEVKKNWVRKEAAVIGEHKEDDKPFISRRLHLVQIDYKKPDDFEIMFEGAK